ncbi:MAG TPA: peptidoglycan recognition family protein [Caldisericia bacterium]|nr:peptidoglycan recognition family protein [Caldisericia bacterium]HPP43065.1 peptidoglycan recognition family protein [Caldisericia bacterium]
MIELLEKEYIVIHHTGIKNSNENSFLVWENIKKFHQIKYKEKFPWYIADYHFGISKDLRVFNGNSIEYPCFHSGDNNINFKSIAVTFLGNFDEELLDKKQFDLGVLMISDLVKRFNIKYEKILKHCEIVNTSCPGNNFPFEELKKEIISNVKDESKKESIIL